MKRRDFLTSLAVIGSCISSARTSNAQAPRKTVRVGIATRLRKQPRKPVHIACNVLCAAEYAIEGCKLVYDCIGLPGDQMHLHPVTARNIAGALRHTKARSRKMAGRCSRRRRDPTRGVDRPGPSKKTSACFIVRDHDGQPLAYVYFEDA
jgi:hypothetical protein